MSGGDDWQVGDLALCVDGANLAVGMVKAGGVYTVNLVRTGKLVTGETAAVLHLSGIHDFVGYAAFRFRKIRPLSDEERDSFTAELSTDQRTPVEA